MITTLHRRIPQSPGVQVSSIILLVTGCAAIAGSVGVLVHDMTPTATVALWLALVIVGHTALLCSERINLLGIISTSAALQWLLAPILAHHFPPSFWKFDMVIPLDEYLTYGIPATAAYWVGLNLAAWGIRTSINQENCPPMSRKLRRIMDAVIVAGIITGIVAMDPYMPARFFVALVILSQFQFFAAFSWMITRTQGWQVRALAVLLYLLWVSAGSGLFFALVLWGGYFVAVYAYQKKWKGSLVTSLAAAMLVLVLLQTVKEGFREYLQSQGQTLEPASFLDRVHYLGSSMWEFSTTAPLERLPTADVLVRFNQGWVIARIMNHVPRATPFAEGETIIEAVKFTIVPRILFPEKRMDSGRVLFRRYAGLSLNDDTAMGLTIPGEMYANFGALGGVLGTLAFGFVIGLIYRWVAKLADRSPYWWAMMPVLLFGVLEPSANIESTMSFTVKSALVVFAVIAAVPRLRNLLLPKRQLAVAEVEWGAAPPLPEHVMAQSTKA